ncbi:MAG: hypothetical protein JST48_11190 [Bacteroidetes bacterium]|nr:hypothetical protein [Bacteroidota bacterium]
MSYLYAMRNVFFILFLLSLFSCGRPLSSEQRKQISENMQAGAIKKISDAELTQAGFDYGKTVASLIQNGNNSTVVDSVENKFNVEIIFLQAGARGLRLVEQQILDAYLATNDINLRENIQRMGKDSLLYTKPLVKERPDGSGEFVRAIGVRMAKKTVILSMNE